MRQEQRGGRMGEGRGREREALTQRWNVRFLCFVVSTSKSIVPATVLDVLVLPSLRRTYCTMAAKGQGRGHRGELGGASFSLSPTPLSLARATHWTSPRRRGPRAEPAAHSATCTHATRARELSPSFRGLLTGGTRGPKIGDALPRTECAPSAEIAAQRSADAEPATTAWKNSAVAAKPGQGKQRTSRVRANTTCLSTWKLMWNELLAQHAAHTQER
jgi:hypothetical protein